jgi:hypothetical protein
MIAEAGAAFRLTKVGPGAILPRHHRTVVRYPNATSARGERFKQVTTRRLLYGIFTTKLSEVGGIGVDASSGIASRDRLSAASRRRDRRVSVGPVADREGSLGSARVDGGSGQSTGNERTRSSSSSWQPNERPRPQVNREHYTFPRWDAKRGAQRRAERRVDVHDPVTSYFLFRGARRGRRDRRLIYAGSAPKFALGDVKGKIVLVDFTTTRATGRTSISRGGLTRRTKRSTHPTSRRVAA